MPREKPLGQLVLVTGAAGFLGRWVSTTFAKAGCRVVGMGHGSLGGNHMLLGLSHWRCATIEPMSIRNLVRECGTPDVVVHAAGGASVRAAEENPREDYRRTVTATSDLLKTLHDVAPDAHFILPSSAAVYGGVQTKSISEDTALAPISTYGLHKRYTEELCLGAASQWALRVTVVRLFSLYGAGLRKQIFLDLWNKIISGIPIVLNGVGTETRDFLHVSDAAKLLLHLVDRKDTMNPLILNGGTGEATSIRHAAELLLKQCRSEAEVHFDGVSRLGDPKHLVATVTRLRSLNYRHSIDIAVGLAEYVTWAASLAKEDFMSE